MDEIRGHGGFFKTADAGRRIMTAAAGTPVSISEKAGEGGAWGMALLAAYILRKDHSLTLPDYLDNMLADSSAEAVKPDPADVEGFNIFFDRCRRGLKIESAAVEALGQPPEAAMSGVQMSKYREMQAQCCEVNMEITRRNLAIFTLGNVSAADHREGVFAIKPSGIACDELRPKDIVVCDFDGQLIEGLLNPSSDTPTHADHCACDIPCTPPMSDEAIEGNYEVETGYQIVNHFAEKGLNHREVEMVLVESHGPFTSGRKRPPRRCTTRWFLKKSPKWRWQPAS